MTAISNRPGGSTRKAGEMKGIKSKVNKLGKWWKSLDTTRDDASRNSDANQFMSVHHDFKV